MEWLLALFVVMVLIILVGFLQLWLQTRISYRRAARSSRFAFERAPDGNVCRLVIFETYQRLEDNLKRYGIIRLDNETVRQFLLRVPEHIPADKWELRAFVHMFEQARYSDHRCGEIERDHAIGSLRDIQRSLEMVVLTEKQLEELVKMAETGADPLEPSPGTVKSMDLWLRAPFVPGPVRVKADPAGKYRPVIPPRDKGRDDLLRKLGPANVPADARLPAITIVKLRKLVADKDHAGTGALLIELAGGLAKDWRVHVEPSLASYLLEFVERCSESGRFRMRPSLGDSMVLLLASTVLAIADERDFLIPDDIKLALVSAGPFVYHAGLRDIITVLDEEIREVPMRGPAFLRPEPIRFRGLAVPVT